MAINSVNLYFNSGEGRSRWLFSHYKAMYATRSDFKSAFESFICASTFAIIDGVAAVVRICPSGIGV